MSRYTPPPLTPPGTPPQTHQRVSHTWSDDSVGPSPRESLEESQRLHNAPTATYTPPGLLGQTALVLKKNVLLKSRNRKAVVLEVLLPMLLICAMLPAYFATDDERFPDQTFDGLVLNQTEHAAPFMCWREDPPADAGLGLYARCNTTWPERNCLGGLCLAVDDKTFGDFLNPLLNPFPSTIPGYDAVALLRRYAAGGDLPLGLSTGAHVAVVPADAGDNATVTLAAELDLFLEQRTHLHAANRLSFKDEGEATAHTTSRNGSNTVWAVVVVTGNGEYTIRSNRTATPETKIERIDQVGFHEGQAKYVSGGFATLQGLVNQFFTGVGAAPTVARPFPVPSHKMNAFLTSAGNVLPMLLILAMIYPVAQLVAAIVREKEGRVREGMLIMGLSVGAFRLSWVLTVALQLFVTQFLVSIPLGAAFLKDAPYAAVFTLCFLYGLAVAAFVLFLSVLFSKGSMAVSVAPFAFLLQALPALSLPEDTAAGARMGLAMFLPTSGFDAGYKAIMARAKVYEVLEWGDTHGDVSLLAACWLLFGCACLYMFLAWYLDETLKGEWGAKRPWFFLCWPPAWFRTAGADATIGEDRCLHPELVEKSISRTAQVAIKSLRKVFPSATRGGRDHVAVDNVNLSLKEGQILSLLGHNGAGKTTLINLLTGMLPTTGGDATVYGASIHGEMSKVRRNIGLCPQHNILWDRLTTAEHLEFFAALKGVPADKRGAAVDRALAEILLTDKKDVYSSQLSGGMKRKLSVEIALIGGSKLVILDEPTAGMDVEARRAVWDILKSARAGRTILLTTHFMDEADILGDSIAVMAAGRVYCWGSSYYLKQKLGVGYLLKMDVAPGAHVVPGITALASEVLGSLQGSHAQKVELLTQAGSEASFRLPAWGLPRFAELFERFECDGARLGVNSFSVGLTTLEEIFLKIAHETEGLGSVDEGQQVNNKANKATFAAAPPPADMDATEPTYAVDFTAKDLECTERLEGSALYSSQVRALLTKRARYVIRDRCTLCLQILLPIVCVSAAFNLGNFPLDDPGSLSLATYDDDVTVPVGPQSNALFRDHLSASLDRVTVRAVDVEDNATAFGAFLLGDHRARDRDVEQWHGYYGSADVFYNTSHAHSVAVGLCQAASARWRAAAGDETLQVKATNHPLPHSEYFLEFVDAVRAYSTAIYVVIPFVLVPATYVAFLVTERVNKVKHVQVVSGLRLGVYWTTNFLFDFVTYSAIVVLAVSQMLQFQKDEYVGSGGAFGATLLLFYSYGLAAIACSYLASFYFENATTGQNVVMMVNFMSGFVLSITVVVVELVGYPDTANGLRFVFRLVPSYCLGDGLIRLSTLPTLKRMGLTGDSPLSMDVTGWDVVYLLVACPVYMALAMAHDYPQVFRAYFTKKSAPSFASADASASPGSRDADVEAEERAILTLPRGDKSRMVTVEHLRKVYPKTKTSMEKVAVRDLTFGIKTGEIFAFLGTNGAGKTTTISMLAGEQQPTGGHAFIKQHDVVTEPQAAKRELGFCPQFDALIGSLTPREHLNLYAGLRGIRVCDRARLVDALLSLLDLEKHESTQTKALSGGNKRKTSIAVALLGGPACVLLDEPTAGMDPLARRAMWTVLQMVAQDRSVLLTTHHLEEVEALAHRTAIMVDGEMQCVGSLAHLRGKFGGAYEVQVRAASPEAEVEVKQWFARTFPGAALLEATNLRLTYRLTGDRPLSQCFRILQTNQKALRIADYAISETSMEQVFTAICRRHAEEKAAPEAEGVTAAATATQAAPALQPDHPLYAPKFSLPHRHPHSLPPATPSLA